MIEHRSPYQAESPMPLPTAEKRTVMIVPEHPSPAGTLQREPSVSHMQITTMIPSLIALSEHPEFQKGIQFGRDLYHNEYEGMLKEEQMMVIAEDECSRQAHREEAKYAHLTNDQPLSFLLHLGVVVGAVDEALLTSRQ